MTCVTICLAALVFLIAPARLCLGVTITVDQAGNGDATTILDGLASCSEGDTLFIRDGRYRESEDLFSFGVPYETYVPLYTDNLTIIGESRDGVVIGPDVADFVDDCPKGFFANRALTVHISNLTIQNVREGTNWEGGGEVSNYRAVGCYFGLVCRAVLPLVVRDSEFETMESDAILIVSPSQDVSISFVECFAIGDTAINLAGVTNASVLNCQADSVGVGIHVQQSSTATIADVSVTRPRAAGLVASLGSRASVMSSSFGAGGRLSLGVSSAAVDISRSSFGLGTDHTLLFTDADESTVRFSNVDVAHGKSVWFQDGSYPALPVKVFDLTNNYWGLQDSTSIAGRIWDINDEPETKAEAVFVPFSLESTPTRKQSWGDVKGRF